MTAASYSEAVVFSSTSGIPAQKAAASGVLLYVLGEQLTDMNGVGAEMLRLRRIPTESPILAGKFVQRFPHRVLSRLDVFSNALAQRGAVLIEARYLIPEVAEHIRPRVAHRVDLAYAVALDDYHGPLQSETMGSDAIPHAERLYSLFHCVGSFQDSLGESLVKHFARINPANGVHPKLPFPFPGLLN